MTSLRHLSMFVAILQSIYMLVVISVAQCELGLIQKSRWVNNVWATIFGNDVL